MKFKEYQEGLKEIEAMAQEAKDLKKAYLSASEVVPLVKEDLHVLRYWEKQFPYSIKRKGLKNNRAYTPSDVETILRVKFLLRVEEYSISGAARVYKATKGHDFESFLRVMKFKFEV
ncbi:MAG: MerR family transcriptional regulator [Desulfobulbaceae bacterium]|nr:MerR family transcriptional regulator [Desulfobulbaceae bacterium]